MIASLDGVVAAVAFDSLIVEVGGVGYRVYASPSVLASTAPGGRLKLFTHHVVREDLQALYGFRTAEELGFFGLLLTVTGVGPKVAMAIVGSRPTAELQLAIMQQDQAVLVSIPGIGKRLAERTGLQPFQRRSDGKCERQTRQHEMPGRSHERVEPSSA